MSYRRHSAAAPPPWPARRCQPPRRCAPRWSSRGRPGSRRAAAPRFSTTPGVSFQMSSCRDETDRDFVPSRRAVRKDTHLCERWWWCEGARTVMRKFGASQIGWSAGSGSTSYTSIAAPPMTPPRSAASKSSCAAAARRGSGPSRGAFSGPAGRGDGRKGKCARAWWWRRARR